MEQYHGSPPKYHAVDSIGTRSKEEPTEVSCCSIESRTANDEADNGDAHAAGDVIRAFIEVARGVADEQADKAGHDIRRRGKGKSDSSVKAKSSDDLTKQLV